METYHPEHLLVYYKFLKNLNFWLTYSTSGIGILQDHPFYCKLFFRKITQFKDFCCSKLCCIPCLLMLLMAYDPIQPTQTRLDWYAVAALALKRPFSIKDGITLSRKRIPGINRSCISSFLCCNARILKKTKNRSAYGCYFRK